MTDKNILILGGRSDIGRAIAHRFAAEGFDVTLAARDPDALAPDCADIALRHQVSADALAYDATDLDGAEAFFASLPDAPTVVVSVIGWLGEQDRTAQDPASARRAIEANLTGPAWAMEVAARRLDAAGGGAVIGVSSVAGDRGRAANYWYGAGKAGFTAILSGLRQKYARGRVRVITVKPGFVATAMTEGMDLPGALTASPAEIGEGVWRAYARGRDVVYLRPVWRLVMTIITHLPEFLFKRTKF